MTSEQSRHVEHLIVGGGLAGCSCAYLLASAGKDVLVIETKDVSTKAKLCAGMFDGRDTSVDGVFGNGYLKRSCSHAPVFAKEDRMEEGVRRHRGYVCVDRRVLDDAVMLSCLRAGATVLDRTRIESVDFEGRTAQVTSLRTGKRVTIAYDDLIGADGAGSQIRRLATGRKQRVIPSLQCTINSCDPTVVMDHFEDAVGYCWHFRYSYTKAYVGICAYSPMKREELKERLSDFCVRRGYELGDLRGAPIPSGDDRELHPRRHVWLVGDAAGLNIAGLGGGMHLACLSAKALSGQFLGGPTYEEKMKGLCGQLARMAERTRRGVEKSPHFGAPRARI